MIEMMTVYANLHAHSTHSDGIYTPAQLAQVAYDEGYKAFSLTDHDTISGTKEMMSACKEKGIECICGIEFSTKFKAYDGGLHITAFHFDTEYPPMKEYLIKLSAKETEQTRVLFNRGIDIGYINGISWEEVLEYNQGVTWLCNEHVFRAMKHKGLIEDHQYQDFFDTCYGKYRNQVPSEFQFMDLEELVALVHAAGGIACIAHPAHPNGNLDIIEPLVECGIDGIEVWHSMLKGSERRRALELARKFDLYVSGGADHSGLLGGQYQRYEKPEETRYYFPPLTLGTTQFFYEEIRDKRKKSDRQLVMDRLLANDSIWITNGGISDIPLK